VSESEEDLARELADELRKLKVEDVLVSVLIQISSIGYRRLGLTEETKDDRDLGQTKLAIDTMKALTPVLEQVVPVELIRDFNSSVANLQLAYAKAVSDVPGGHAPGQVPETEQATDGDSNDDDDKSAANEAESSN
jgi:hypothetical protein